MNGVQCTMHGVAPLMIVNGPYAQKIGLHGGNGCFGPGFRANATIGRAIRLMLLNLGGGIAGHRLGHGIRSPIRYTACLTENMAAQSVGKPRGVARLCARGQRDHLRHGRKPAPALRRREHGAGAAADRHRRLDDRAGLVEHVVRLRHGGRHEPAARAVVRGRRHEPRRRASPLVRAGRRKQRRAQARRQLASRARARDGRRSRRRRMLRSRPSRIRSGCISSSPAAWARSPPCATAGTSRAVRCTALTKCDDK